MPRTRKAKRHSSRKSMREWRANNPVKAAFSHLRQNAKARRKEFLLTFEQFTEFCERTNYIKRRGRKARRAHIDRIDHRLGYAIDNIQILSCSKNSIKGNAEKRMKRLEETQYAA